MSSHTAGTSWTVCTSCGAPATEGDTLCAHCRVNLARVPRQQPRPPTEPGWEYRDLLIPLGLVRRASDSPERVREQLQRYGQVVFEHLTREQTAGWQSNGATDWTAMLTAGRLQWRTDMGFLGPSPDPTTVYQSVTIRLKRPAP